jgi:Fructose/tagatose bisphosphate aldolase
MAIVSAEKFVAAARENGYAIGGFNTNNLEWTQAILRAAQAKQAPVLIQTSMGAGKYMGGYKTAKYIIENLVESMNITVPVAIHLDHGHYEDAKEVIEVGYTSLMFDGSHLPIAENLEKLKKSLSLLMLKVSQSKLKLGLSVVKKMVSSVLVN